MNIKIRLGIFLFFLLTLLSCKKSDNRAYYPPVDEYINITLVSYNSLSVPGGWAYANGGLKGLIIYRRSNEEFVAFDRNCTYNEDNSCGSAEVSSDNVTVICSCDGSSYSIFDGSVISGPAGYSLKNYNTYFNTSNNILRIYN